MIVISKLLCGTENYDDQLGMPMGLPLRQEELLLVMDRWLYGNAHEPAT